MRWKEMWFHEKPHLWKWKFFSNKIQKFIALHSKRVTNKNTRSGSRSKFGLGMTQSGCKTKTAKHFEVRIRRNMIVKYFKRSLFCKIEVGSLFMIYTAVRTHSPHKYKRILDWNFRALAILKICWCFLSTT